MVHFAGRSPRTLLAALVLFGIFAGCEAPVETSYGHRSPLAGGQSVNGTAVLAHLFQQAGHQVHSWHVLSPAARRADVIVWIPDRFEPPNPDARQWLTRWLAKVSCRRKLIYVGRDFDAAPVYWHKVRALATDDREREYIGKQILDVETDLRVRRSRMPGALVAGWFAVQRLPKPRKVRQLSGPWSEGIRAERLEMEIRSTIRPASAKAKILLAAAGEPLVSRQAVGDGQLFVVANGAFLLNLALVNHEHRKLARRLIDAVGPAGQKVLFLESGPDDVEVQAEDPTVQMQTGLEMFSVWPINYVALHLAILGVAYCLYRFPLFGLPRERPARRHAGFDQHVEAMADRLRDTRDYDYAARVLEHFQSNVQTGRLQPPPCHPDSPSLPVPDPDHPPRKADG